MSRTVEVPRNQSPVEATIFYNGDLGRFSYLHENNPELTEIALPFRFTVVDDGGHRITGSEGLGKDAPRWKSNMAHERFSNHLRVWLDHSPEVIEAEGTWKPMSSRMSIRGARYTKLIWIITDLGFGKILACLQLKGRALSAWFDDTSKKKINPCGNIAFIVKETRMMQGEKGKPSPVPVFETTELSAETEAMAKKMDKELQQWLETQFDDSFAEAPAIAQRVDRFPPENESPWPTQAPAEAVATEPVASDFDDLPF